VAGHPYESTRTMPRTISPIQRDKFLAMVSAVPKGSIELVSLLDDSDSYVLAVMLDDMLRRAGWSVSGIRRSLLPDNPIGLTMVVRSPETTPPFVPALQNALEAIGFPCAPIRNGDRRSIQWPSSWGTGPRSEQVPLLRSGYFLLRLL